MYSLISSIAYMVAIGLIGMGLALELVPSLRNGSYRYQTWFKPALATNMVLFIGAMIALGILGGHDAMAAGEAAASGGAELVKQDVSIGMGIEIFAVAIPTTVATVSAGIAVGQIGSASLAVIAEKPEVFGKTLIYMGLAEGIAIYGLVMSILMLGKI